MKVKNLIMGALMFSSIYSFGQHPDPGSDTTATAEETEKTSIQVFAPNAFTPDGDYYNDSWKVYVEGNDPYSFHLTVFSRSGQIVWESYDSTGEWDGNFGGDLAPDDVYVWVIETKDAYTDKIHQFKGFITILR